MSTHGRHRAPKTRKVRLQKLPALALVATVAVTGAVAVRSHGSSASSQPHSAVSVQHSSSRPDVSTAHTHTSTSKAALVARKKAVKAHAKAVAKARAHVKAVAAFKARSQAAAKAKARAHIKALARTKASVATYVSARSSTKSSVATRSRAIRSLRGQVASLKSQLRKPAAIGKKVIAVADNYRGVPYVRGGTSPRGFDCSGYTQYVYSQLGISLPRVADAQAHSAVPVRRAFAKPGDLVFYHSGSGYVYHVGIYAGGGKVWHAPYPGRAVEKVRISTHSVTFGRVSRSAAQNALAIKLAKKTAKLAHLIHNK
jgi:cell wall-associated NlpC family hydrolase